MFILIYDIWGNDVRYSLRLFQASFPFGENALGEDCPDHEQTPARKQILILIVLTFKMFTFRLSIKPKINNSLQ